MFPDHCLWRNICQGGQPSRAGRAEGVGPLWRSPWWRGMARVVKVVGPTSSERVASGVGPTYVDDGREKEARPLALFSHQSGGHKGSVKSALMSFSEKFPSGAIQWAPPSPGWARSDPSRLMDECSQPSSTSAPIYGWMMRTAFDGLRLPTHIGCVPVDVGWMDAAKGEWMNDNPWRKILAPLLHDLWPGRTGR